MEHYGPMKCIRKSNKTEDFHFHFTAEMGKRTWNDWLIHSRRARKIGKGSVAFKIF